MSSRQKTNRRKLIFVCGIALTTFIGVGLIFSSSQPTYPDDKLVILEAVETVVVEPEEAEEVFAKQRTFGYSEKGRAIDGYEIGNGTDCMLFFGGIHGNEKGTVELLKEFADTVIAEPNLLASSKKLVVVPLINPDGYFDNIYRDNANGVNLNRNFPTTNWIQYPDAETFAGSKPFSENESLTIKAIVEECDPSLMIAFHSQGGVVSPEAGSESVALAEWYIARTGYFYYNDWDYPGTATGWFTESTGNPSLTIEITDHMTSDWEINRPALLELIGS